MQIVNIMAFLVIFIINFYLWYILSGSSSFFLLFCGFISSLFVAHITIRHIYKDVKIKWSGLLLSYLPCLLKDVVHSAFVMLCRAWKITPAPDCNFFNMGGLDANNEIANAILSFSITFTPGTIVVNPFDVTVNCYDNAMADDLFRGKLDDRVAKIF